MKRKEYIDGLIKEGFTLKTLINFNDNQLKKLSDRILHESVKGNVIMNKDTSDTNDIKKVTDTGTNVELKEKLNLKKKNIPKNIKMKPGVPDTEENLDEWVENITEKEYHPFTSKNEILETIKVKLDEFKTSHETGKNVKSGHNGIPEWFTYDAIKTSTNPTIAPPKTKPGVAPKRQNPLKPGVGPNPKPKAGVDNTNPTIAPPKISPNVKPVRKNPLKPGVGPNPKPKAEKK